MKKDRDLSKLFSKGQELETSLSTSSIFSKDSGLHLTSYKVEVEGKTTVIDNLSVYGSTVLILESKNFRWIEGDAEKPFWRGRGTGRYFSIPSPLKQNQYHVKLLRKYLLEKGLRLADFKIEHYIIVPDTCEVEVEVVAKDHLMHQSEILTLKRRLAFYNPKLEERLARIIKEGLF